MTTTKTKFFPQAFYNVTATRPTVAGYELIAHTKYHDEWIESDDTEDIVPDQLEHLIVQALQGLPQKTPAISFNLHPQQFVQPHILQTIKTLQVHYSGPFAVELTVVHEPAVATRTLIASARRYAEAGIQLWIDDVGCGQNLPGIVEGLTPYAIGYKFSMQTLRGFISDVDLTDRQTFWYTKAQKAKRSFVLTGIETEAEYVSAKNNYPGSLLQGSYLNITPSSN